MAAPEIINPNRLEAERRMPEQRVLDDTIKAIQTLDIAYDERSTEARRRLLTIEETLDQNVANFTPEKQEQLAERVRFIKNLLVELESSPHFNLVQQKYEDDPIRHKEKLVEDQKKYQALLDRFGISGLQLVEAQGPARSRTEYGISHQGNYLGNLIVGNIGQQATTAVELIVQIMELLSFHKIPFRLEQNQEFTNLPYTIDISPEQRAFIERLGLRLTKDGIFGLSYQGRPNNFRWNEPGTKQVTIKILDPTNEIWQVIILDENGTQDVGTVKGKEIIGIQT